MNRVRFTLSCAALAALSCGFGSSGLETIKTSEGGNSSDDSSSGGDDAPGSSSSDDSATPPHDATSGDGGRDATMAAPDGDAGKRDGASAEGGPNPGVVACAGTDCALGSNICCTCPACFPPFPTNCYPAFPGCVTGQPLHCDDRTDCPAMEVCCWTYASGVFTGSSCKAACAGTDVQLCRVDAECVKGSCKTASAIPGFTACM
jgi:hypothetical protein